MFVLGETDPKFLQEVWALYGVGVTILLLRFAIRVRSVGFKGLQGDDLFALLVLGTYTVDAVTVHNVYYMSTNVEGAAIQQDRKLTAAEIDQLIEGSKQQLVAWYSYATLVWCLKGTMIFFFKRMTMGHSQQRIVNYIGIACVVTYLAVILTITFGCFPVAHNWQVAPDPGLKCTLKPQNFIVMTILNVLTDAAILYVPLPLLWTLKVPVRQKIVIGILLSSGIFVISAAIIRIVSTLAANPSALTVNRWGVRETIVGIIAVNVPILRPLFSRAFWKSGGEISAGTSGHGTASHGLSTAGRHGAYEMASSINDGDAKPPRASYSGSEEEIVTKSVDVIRKTKKPSDGNVMIQTTYEVTTAPRENDDENRTAWYDGGFAEAKAIKEPESRV